MALFTKAQLLKYTGGTLLVGGLVWGTLTWTGTADLQSIKEDFNYVKAQYDTAVGNISIYKTELLRRAGIISDSQAKAEVLGAKVKQLEAQLKAAQNGSTADQQTIAQLQAQITSLQSQIDNGITEEDFNSVLAEVERLQGELQKANQEVAELKTYIDGQTGGVKEIAAVTAEEVQNDVDVQNLYYTWQLTNGGTNNVTAYLDKLNIVDELNESPVAVEAGMRNTYNIGNLRAFAKLYDSVNGQGAFATKYNEQFANDSGNDDMNSRIATAMSSISVTASIDGTTITFRWNKTVPVTPNGATKSYTDWWNTQNGSLNI